LILTFSSPRLLKRAVLASLYPSKALERLSALSLKAEERRLKARKSRAEGKN